MTEAKAKRGPSPAVSRRAVIPPAEPSESDDGLLTSQEVATRYSVHIKTLPKLIETGRIPKPLEGWEGATKRWLKSEIVAHIRGLRRRDLAEQAK